MDTVSLLKAVLTVVVGWLLKIVFAAIGVAIDEVLFNTLVVAIVTYFLTLFGYSATVRVASFVQRSFRKNK